mgnify:CR=1 FL=1
MAVNTDSIVSNLYSTYSSQSKTGKQIRKCDRYRKLQSFQDNGNYGKTIGNAKLLKKEQSIIRN